MLLMVLRSHEIRKIVSTAHMTFRYILSEAHMTCTYILSAAHMTCRYSNGNRGFIFWDSKYSHPFHRANLLLRA